MHKIIKNYGGAFFMDEKDKMNRSYLEELSNCEDCTKYGEFVSSYFAWTGLNRQKIRADELNNMTKEKNSKNISM